LLTGLHDNEAFAIWLEGVALVTIFFLDFLEYQEQGEERRKEDDERRKLAHRVDRVPGQSESR
jgi:hypothetical protein